MPPLNNFQKSFLAIAVGNALISTDVSAATINVGAGCSLIEAIQSANTDAVVNTCAIGSGADTIVLPASHVSSFLTSSDSYYGVASALPTITSEITIQGTGGSNGIIERAVAAPEFRLLAVAYGFSLTLQSITLRNGKLSSANGAGIYAYSANLTIIDSTISGNNASAGGGIYADGSDVTISSSTITGNSATTSAGIDLEYYSNLTMTDSTVSNNVASTSFAGIYSSSPGTFEIIDSTISGNMAGTFVAGIGVNGDDTNTVTITGGEITNNTATNIGGGVYVDRASLDISGLTISGNAASKGAGVYANDAIITISDSTISRNTATMSGGGLQIKAYSSLTLTGSTLSANTVSGAPGNGGAICTADSTLVINTSQISDSSASGNGAAIYSFLELAAVGTVEINKSTISGSSTGADGGGLWHAATEFTLRDSTLSGNIANTGSALSIGNGTVKIRNSTIYNNSSSPGRVSFYSSVVPDVANTIIAGSLYGDCSFSTLLSPGNGNWFEDNSCDGVAQFSPLLNPLADNNAGLPNSTLTHAPGLSSGVLNGGKLAYCGSGLYLTDQRGAPRDAPCDIGSVERQRPEAETCFVVKAVNAKLAVFCL